MFTLAIERDAATVNPCRGVAAPKVPEQERPYVSESQLAELTSAMPGHLRLYVQLIGWTGLRRTEALGLVWANVARDFSMLWVRGKGAKIRRVPLAPRAAEALRVLRKARDREETRVFPALTESNVNHDFRRAADAAGFHGWTPHYLRHGFCSRLVRAGNDLPVVQRLMGHASIQTTMRYASWAPEGADVLAIERMVNMDPQLDRPRMAR